MNEDQLYVPSTNVDVNLSSPHNNIASGGGFDFEKYGPYVDSIKNLLVPSLERSVYEGMEVLVYSQKKNLSSQFDRGCSSQIYGHTDPKNVGIVQGIIKPAFKYWIKDGLINCFINAIVINNRLNKICRDWEIIRYGRHASPYISELNIFDESDQFSQCIDESESLSHTSFESIIVSSHESQDVKSAYSDYEHSESNDNVNTLGQDHLNIISSSGSSVFVVSKAQDNIESHKVKGRGSMREKKITPGISSEYSAFKLQKPILKHHKRNNDLITAISKPHSYQRVDKSSLLCNCEDVLREAIKINSSSSDFHLTEQLKQLEIAMQNTCFSFDDILCQVDEQNTNKCEFFCKLRAKYIDLKLKTKNHDGSMTNLFIDQVKIARSDLQGLERLPMPLEASKSERDDIENSSRFNSIFNEISNGNIDGVTQSVIRNSNLDKDPDVDNFINTLPTPSEFLGDILSSTKNDNDFVISDQQLLKECNSENSCNCSTSTEYFQNITNGSENFFPNINSNISNKEAYRRKKINEKSSVNNEQKMKDFNTIRFRDDVQYFENNSISAEVMNNNNLEETDSTTCKTEYDIFEKVRLLEILKTIFEENKGQICLCNAREIEEKKFMAETSVEYTGDRNKMKDDSSSLNHVVSNPVSSNISLASKITRVIPVENIKTEVSDKYEINFNHFYDLDETELTKRTSTPERKKEIESLLNKEEFEMQEFDKNKIRSYSSRNLTDILAEGKENHLSDSLKDKFENFSEYFDVKKEIEDKECNFASQEVQEIGNVLKTYSETRDSNKSGIKSNSGTNVQEVKNRQSYPSTMQEHNEPSYIIDEIEENNYNLGSESEKEKNNSSEKMIEMLNVDDRNQLVYDKKNSTEPIKKRLSSSEKVKSKHKCEFFYLLDEIEENNRTSTPERKREIESLLQKEDLNLQDVNKDKTKSFFSRNIVEGLPEVKKKRSVSQRHSVRVDDFVTSRFNNNSKKSSVILKNPSDFEKKVSHVSKVSRSVSQKEIIYKVTDFHSSNISLDDLIPICQCSSDSNSFLNKNFKIPPLKDQLLNNKKKKKKSNNRPRRHFNIRALISAICRGLKNIFSRVVLRKLKHLLKTHIFKSTKKGKNTTSTFCVPKSCESQMPNYNSIDPIKMSKFSHAATSNKYSDYALKSLKKKNINPSFHRQPNGSYAKFSTGVINKDKQGSKYTCCRDRNNVREDWTNPRTANSYQSMNNFSNSCDCDAVKKQLYHRKYMRRRPLEYSVCDTRKFKRSSFTPKESHSCCYYKNLAAKHLAEYLNFRIRHQERSDSDEVHCKECLESTDSELKSMLNQYLKSSRSKRKKSMQKKYKNVKECFNN